MSKAIEKTEVQGITQQTGSSAVTPMEMLNSALERGVDADQLSKLLDLQERWEAANARREYLTAMQAFKANPPRIVKDRHVNYTTSKGTTDYKHASLAQVSDVIGGALARHGISHAWKIDQSGDRIAVTCTLTHTAGHSESVTLYAPDDPSGGKNSVQAIGSTVSYLQRYTLLSASGVAVEDDNDGAGWDLERISEEQAATIRDLIEASGADEGKFLAHFKVPSISAIPARNFAQVMNMLRAKQKQGAK